MEINRQNYEIFLLDYIEGQLPENMVPAILLFLKNNPDIELESMALMENAFVPENVKFEGKDSIKKNPESHIPGISKFEQLSVSFYEDEISDNEIVELNSIIEKDETKKSEHKLIGVAKFGPDFSIKFPHKNGLKHYQSNNWIHKNRVYLAIAAGIAIVLSFGIIFFQDNGVKYGKEFNFQAYNFKIRSLETNHYKTSKLIVKDNQVKVISTIDSFTIREKSTLELVDNKQIALAYNTLIMPDYHTMQPSINKSMAANSDDAGYRTLQVYIEDRFKEKVLKQDKQDKITFINVVNAFGRFTKKVFNKKLEIEKNPTENGGSLYAIKTDTHDFYTVRNPRKKNGSK